MKQKRAHSRRWLVVGSATIDCVVQGDERGYKRGGVAVYGGLTLLYLGHDVAVCTNLATGDADVVAALSRAGADLYLGESAETTHFVNCVLGDQRQQQMPRAAAPIGRKALVSAAQGAECVLLGPLHPLDIGCAALMWLEKEGDKAICADVQGMVRSVVDGVVHPRVDASMDALLRAASWIKVAQDELHLLLQWASCDLDGLMRRYALREVVVTDGSRGGYVQQDGRRIHPFGAVAVVEARDPTGAGDVFFATYMSERLARGQSVDAAAARAADLAAQQVSGEFLGEDVLLLERCGIA